MKVFDKTSELQDHLEQLREQGLTLGFTPTMGALHEGHYSLIRRSNDQNDVSLCSIFVNPTQFNQASDLDKYPRTLDQDIQGLENANCDILFAPSVSEIYPEGSDYEVDVDLEGLEMKMEGEHRPGHFDGVVQVVKRLLDITKCDRLYMGQKDFQQFTIIAKMIEQLKMNVQLVVCPILREEDGLAMSSRNVRLTEQHRKKASIIYRVLCQAKEWLAEGKPNVEISYKAMEYLDLPGFKPEYFDIIDGKKLEKFRPSDFPELVVACVAVWAGDVRLIDNMILKGKLS